MQIHERKLSHLRPPSTPLWGYWGGHASKPASQPRRIFSLPYRGCPELMHTRPAAQFRNVFWWHQQLLLLREQSVEQNAIDLPRKGIGKSFLTIHWRNFLVNLASLVTQCLWEYVATHRARTEELVRSLPLLSPYWNWLQTGETQPHETLLESCSCADDMTGQVENSKLFLTNILQKVPRSKI